MSLQVRCRHGWLYFAGGLFSGKGVQLRVKENVQCVETR